MVKYNNAFILSAKLDKSFVNYDDKRISNSSIIK